MIIVWQSRNHNALINLPSRKLRLPPSLIQYLIRVHKMQFAIRRRTLRESISLCVAQVLREPSSTEVYIAIYRISAGLQLSLSLSHSLSPSRAASQCSFIWDRAYLQLYKIICYTNHINSTRWRSTRLLMSWRSPAADADVRRSVFFQAIDFVLSILDEVVGVRHGNGTKQWQWHKIYRPFVESRLQSKDNRHSSIKTYRQ